MAVLKVVASGRDGGVYVNDVKVVGEQGAVVASVVEADADSTFGAPEAALVNEIKVVLNLVVARLRAHGLIETAS